MHLLSYVRLAGHAQPAFILCLGSACKAEPSFAPCLSLVSLYLLQRTNCLETVALLLMSGCKIAISTTCANVVEHTSNDVSMHCPDSMPCATHVLDARCCFLHRVLQLHTKSPNQQGLAEQWPRDFAPSTTHIHLQLCHCKVPVPVRAQRVLTTRSLPLYLAQGLKHPSQLDKHPKISNVLFVGKQTSDPLHQELNLLHPHALCSALATVML